MSTISILAIAVLVGATWHQLGLPLYRFFRNTPVVTEHREDARIAALEAQYDHARSVRVPGAVAAADQLEAELRDIHSSGYIHP